MISCEGTVTFVWRCSDCPAVYDGESLSFLLDDGTSKACSCGGRLIEGVGPVPERDARTPSPVELHSTALYRYREAVGASKVVPQDSMA